MGYVPGFSNDIFISYSHFDDQAVDGPGWVTDFHRRLVIEVEEELGAKVQVWRDKRISGATDFTKDLDKQVRGSAMLLAILSPGYVNSRWCDWELTGFAGSRRIADLWVDTKCRALKIFKRPADVGKLRVLAETEGVKMFDVDPATELAFEMETSSESFKHCLAELGHDIGFVLRAMRKGRTVFLGTASPSLHDQRERVRQELNGRDYRVLTAPEGPPDDQSDDGALGGSRKARCRSFSTIVRHQPGIRRKDWRRSNVESPWTSRPDRSSSSADERTPPHSPGTSPTRQDVDRPMSNG